MQVEVSKPNGEKANIYVPYQMMLWVQARIN